MQDMSYFENIASLSEEVNGDEGVVQKFEITKDSSDVEVLDFIVLYICTHIQQHFALKGGYALSKLLEFPRATKDVDFSIEIQEDYDKFKNVLVDIGEILIDKGFITSYEVKDTISATMSGGIKYKRDGVEVLGVDIGLHQLRSGVGKVDIGFAETNMFKPERMLADKISAILSYKRFRRVKDVYDVYCITNTFYLDYKLLKELTDLRMEGQEDNWNNIPFNDEVIVQYEHAWNKLNLVEMITDEPMRKPAFDEVIARFYKLTRPLKYNDIVKSWSSTHGRWLE